MTDGVVTLAPMTRERMHRYFQGFVIDYDLYMNGERLRPYVYDPARVDAFFDSRSATPDCECLAVLLGEEVIGDLVLKHIDHRKKECELGIHLVNDTVKNQGYGTRAERLAVEYAVRKLGMRTVLAGAVLKNTRSQHVLEKVGFRQVSRDERFVYYIWKKEGERDGLSTH